MFRINIVYVLLLSLFLLIVSAVSPAVAESGLLVTQQWFADDTAGLSSEEAMTAFQQGRGDPLLHSVFQTANEPQQIWVLLTAHNQNSQPIPLRLLAGAPYSRLLRARLFRPESATNLMVNETSRLLIHEYENRPFINTFAIKQPLLPCVSARE